MAGRTAVGGYAVISGVAVAARVLPDFLPVVFVSAGQQALWSWRFFPVFAACFAAASVDPNPGARRIYPVAAEPLRGASLPEGALA